MSLCFSKTSEAKYRTEKSKNPSSNADLMLIKYVVICHFWNLFLPSHGIQGTNKQTNKNKAKKLHINWYTSQTIYITFFFQKQG